MYVESKIFACKQFTSHCNDGFISGECRMTNHEHIASDIRIQAFQNPLQH
jgi:hypothetical protein